MKSFDQLNWRAPANWVTVKTIEMHTAGEPLRIITSGLPALEGRTVLEKRADFRARFDHLRTGTMWEPRGHADMYGAVVTKSLDADFDVFFLHNEGYSTMCGHAIIALTTLIVESGMVSNPERGREVPVSFNVPAGRIEARATLENGKARSVSFRNVPSFLYVRDGDIEVPGLGHVRFDIAYGGAFYAVVRAPSGIELVPGNFDRLVNYGRRIKRAVADAISIRHPFEPDLSFLYGTIFTGPATQQSAHSRNVCIFADGELDRSPTGSGVSARAALHHAKGELRLQEKITIESILGTTMSVEVVDRAAFGPHEAIIPEVSGEAFITGQCEFAFDPDDPLKRGFIFR